VTHRDDRRVEIAIAICLVLALLMMLG